MLEEQQPVFHSQEQTGREKQVRWNQRKAEVEGIPDIDEGIKETVIALNVLGVHTVMSCEGHLDRGGAPWVDIRAPDVDELRDKMYGAIRRAEAARSETHLSQKEKGSLYADAHKL